MAVTSGMEARSGLGRLVTYWRLVEEKQRMTPSVQPTRILVSPAHRVVALLMNNDRKLIEENSYKY